MQTRADRMLMVLPRARTVRKAVEAGYRVWSVWDPVLGVAAEHGDVVRGSEEVLVADLTDEAGLRALVVRAAEEYGVGRVMYLSGGTGMRPVLDEAHRLGLAGNPRDAHRILGSRAALRELLRHHDRLGVRFRRVERSDELARAVAESVGFPAVVCALGAGADPRPVLVADPGGLADWAARTRGPCLVEEFVAGPQYAVTTLSVDGMHQVVGVTATETDGPPHFVATGHVHPAPIGARAEAEIRSAVCALLDLAGFEQGPADTTVVLGATGPRVISCRPRFARDGIPLLLRLTRGIDLEEAFFQALRLGRCLPPTEAVGAAASGIVRLPPGSPAAVDAAPRHGCVVVGGANPGEAAERLTEARERLTEARERLTEAREHLHAQAGPAPRIRRQ